MKRTFLAALALAVVLSFSVTVFADEAADIGSPKADAKFIPMFLAYQSRGAKFTPEDAAKLAKFEVIMLGRFRFYEIGDNAWEAVKRINPNTQFFTYQQGPDVWVEDGGKELTAHADPMRLNNIARYTNARGHSMGNLDKDNPDLFLLSKKDGKRCHTYEKDFRYLMDFGSAKFHKYWLEATAADILDTEYVADGIFIDNTSALIAGYEHDPSAKYDTDEKWIPAMHKFQIEITKGLHKRGQKTWTNTCSSVKPLGYTEWLALDADPDGPDIIGEEGAFTHGWNGNRFYPEEKWKRQIDIMVNLKRAEMTMFCHTTLLEDETGLDNYKKPVSYWQTLHYALGSFLLGKNDERNNAYFYFFSQTEGLYFIKWFDEYDRIDLGKSVGQYQVTKIGESNIYFREFEDGYVYVNPSEADVAEIKLPAACKQLTHETINDDPAGFADIETIELKSHHAAILVKSASLAK